MAGILKVDKYQDFNGNDIMTSDGSGNITLNNTALKMTPAFAAYVTGDQSVTASTWTKIQFNTEILDTNSAYDATTNYRFTVPSDQAGKYYIGVTYVSGSDSSNLTYTISGIYKNGTIFQRSDMNSNSTANAQFRRFPLNNYFIADLNVGDYIEAFAFMTGTSPKIFGGSTPTSFFNGYKLIGA